MEALFQIGHISGLKGIDGSVKLKFNPEFTNALKLIFLHGTDKFKEGQFLFLEIDFKPVPFLVEEFKLEGDNRALVHLEDINSKEDAHTLLQQKVFLPESILVKEPGQERPHSLLVGYQAQDKKAGRLGEIEEVIDMPMHQLAKITFNEKEVLLPLNEESIEKIDHDNKVLYMNLPEGILEL